MAGSGYPFTEQPDLQKNSSWNVQCSESKAEEAFKDVYENRHELDVMFKRLKEFCS